MTEPERPNPRSTPPPGPTDEAGVPLPPPAPEDRWPPPENRWPPPDTSSMPPPPSPGLPPTPPPTGEPAQPEPKTGGFFMTRYVGTPITGWHGWYPAAGVFIALFATIVGSVLVAIFDPRFETTAAKEASQLVLALALIGTALGFALIDSGGDLKQAFGKLGLRTRLTIGAIGLTALAFVIYLVCAAILAPLLQPDQQDVTQELGTNKESIASIVVAGILIVILAPLSEELFFRGFMFASLKRSLSLWPAALITSVVWGLLHLSGGNIGVAVQLMVFGIVLAWLYERSGTLWAPMTAHALNNTIAFIVLIHNST